MQELASGQGRRHDHAPIDPDHAAIAWPGDRVGHVRERDVPAAAPIPGDPVGLHPLGDRAAQPEPHPTNLGHLDLPVAAVEPHNVMRFDRHLPETFMHTGFAPRRVPVSTCEEVPHRLSEIPQRLLLHGLRPGRQPREGGASLGQLRCLFVIARRLTARPPKPLLLHRQIPHEPGLPAMLGQRHHLLSSGQQPVTRHTRTITTPTDNPPKGDVAFPPAAKATGFHATTNR